MKCRACNRAYRKGRMVYLAGERGIVRARVCGPCAKNAAPLVVASAAPRCDCGAPATSCGACVGDKVTKAAAKAAGVPELAAGLEKISAAYDLQEGEWAEGVAEGIRIAARRLVDMARAAG